MLTVRLLQIEARQQGVDWEAGLTRLLQSGAAREEFKELCNTLLNGVKLHADESPIVDECPLFLHRQSNPSGTSE